jgi:parallel beta-helix repeat protein
MDGASLPSPDLMHTPQPRPTPTRPNGPRQKSVRVLLPLACLGLLLGVSVAQAGAGRPSVLHVNRADAACSDSGSGQAAHPFCTIRAAAARARAGQTVRVAAGVYREDVTVLSSGTRRRPIVFTAARRGTVVVRGRVNGFEIKGRHWVTVKGFTVTHTSGYGISVQGSSFVRIVDNRVSRAGRRRKALTRTGIWLSHTRDSLVAGNIADHNTYAGIELTDDSTRNLVLRNEVFANASGYTRQAPGIHLSAAPRNTLRGNVAYDNEDSGLECYAGANEELIVENVSYGNGDHGIDNHACTGNRILGNTVYRNATAGINVEADSTNTTIANNISVDNGMTSTRTRSDIRVERGSTAGTSMNSDLVYVSAPTTVFIWNSAVYRTLRALQDATGQEPHSIYADPRFANPAKGNFHLLAGSPAIDSADSALPGWPSTDILGHPRVDDPHTPNTGLGPRTYDDRGAYEYQPKRTQRSSRTQRRLDRPSRS